MTIHESKMFVQALPKYFPQTTLEQAMLVAETAAPMMYNRAVAVMKTHARQSEFFSVKGITEALRGDWIKFQESTASKDSDKTISGLRGMYNDFIRSDIDLIRDHFVHCANEVRKADQAGQEMVLKMIRGHAKKALMEIGHDHADAVELVEDWCGKACAA